MVFELEIPPKIEKIFRKLYKKDRKMFECVRKALDQILERPTEIGDSKRYELKMCRSTHIRSYVLVWTVKKKRVKIVLFEHHDHAYKK